MAAEIGGNHMMTLDEAIVHCREKACGDCACAEDHKQLAEWLEELQQYKEHGIKDVVRCHECANLNKVDDFEMWCTGNGYPERLVRPDGYCDTGKRHEEGH